ncbi:hypothetical protein, unlikely [Trypanosoma brucei gambiense DAL972]|uniref:Uncharacterized protein n=1 Tax=Trypanosoma brucei gambiense (strain MHOM/CI/86/DAL972) TaxID=679716 RepID=C9ZQV7_TRYB9|nr:hypothetical protein, unlikely [Trypanosoma brucei gambiense DAL972]CBH11787.1 hypothetical protein, unlikely [Trypanosoma brucei gambiense DAL972]|eukprot:XP_011774072.1 hypothetical protein, unlikely [Trypanosoma brucei gambiense DAL972]
MRIITIHQSLYEVFSVSVKSRLYLFVIILFHFFFLKASTAIFFFTSFSASFFSISFVAAWLLAKFVALSLATSPFFLLLEETVFMCILFLIRSTYVSFVLFLFSH